MKAVDLLVLTQDQETAAAIAAVAESGPAAAAPGRCANMLELRTQLSKKAAAGKRWVALVDIDEAPEHILGELGKVIATYPQVRFIVLARESNEKLLLRAMHAGVKHFLRKNRIATELSGLLKRFTQQDHEAAGRLGNIIAVFSCSGGCGATTVALNIANELRLATARRVLLVDLDVYYGAVASYLGVRGRYGIGHVLNHESRIDSALIESTAVKYTERLDVLLSPASAEVPVGGPLNYENLPAVAEACREAYDYVVIDAPRLTREVIGDLASRARISVVVFQLMVRDVTVVKSLLPFLADQGVAGNRLLLLASRVCRRGPLLRPSETQRALGVDIRCPIRSDGSKVVKSLNRGLPLASVARYSGVRRDYRRLARQIHKYSSNGAH